MVALLLPSHPDERRHEVKSVKLMVGEQAGTHQMDGRHMRGGADGAVAEGDGGPQGLGKHHAECPGFCSMRSAAHDGGGAEKGRGMARWWLKHGVQGQL